MIRCSEVTREELQEQRNALDDFARLQGQALNRLFEPWFLGTAKTNYEVLVETLEWTMRDMMKQGFAKWKSELLEMMLDPEEVRPLGPPRDPSHRHPTGHPTGNPP